eukprot:1550789-Pleurochrysis_carterae.AAC.2
MSLQFSPAVAPARQLVLTVELRDRHVTARRVLHLLMRPRARHDAACAHVCATVPGRNANGDRFPPHTTVLNLSNR